MGRTMSWRPMPFGKYAERTLPEILVKDLDWFYWMLPKLYGGLGDEARNLAERACAIKIPREDPSNYEVEYRYDGERRFCGFRIVEADSAVGSKRTLRLPYVDLSRAVRKKYDKRSSRLMIREFRNHYFGKRRRLTKARCERFFSTDRNFVGF
jgi:hypothetical protein